MKRVLSFLFITAFMAHASSAESSSSRLDRNCVEGDAEHGCTLYSLSLIELIANAERYNGKQVHVVGYARLDKVHYDESGDSIYVSKEAADHSMMTKDGLYLELSWDEELSYSKKQSDGYAIIEGIFSAKNQGHMGLWSGSIGKIRRFQWL